MVLAPVQARKGQSGSIFAQEAMTVRLRVSGSSSVASGQWPEETGVMIPDHF
jgi:hypothetical protein